MSVNFFKTPVKNTAIIYRDNSPIVQKKVKQATKWLKNKKVQCHFLPGQNILDTPANQKDLAHFFNTKKVDLMLVLGGDGTYLRAVQCTMDYSIPFLGINIGSLGFLTVHRQESMEHCLESVLSGKMKIEERHLIDISVMQNNNCADQYIALNDLVIERGAFSHLISLSVTIDNQDIYSVKSDGLIVSSPTGSTAYNLAGGGPILHPQVNSLSITPICSHSLTSRPVIVPDTCQIYLQINKPEQKAFVTIDGRKCAQISKNHIIKVQKSKIKHKTLRELNYNYFMLLKNKLKFSQ